MRGPEDLLPVRITLECGLTLDIERIQEDPTFNLIAQRANNDYEAVVMYLKHYISQALFLADMPSTNGPADVYRASIEPIFRESPPE